MIGTLLSTWPAKMNIYWMKVECINFWISQTFCCWEMSVDCLYPKYVWFTSSRKDFVSALAFRSVCSSPVSCQWASLFPPPLITNLLWSVTTRSNYLAVWHRGKLLRSQLSHLSIYEQCGENFSLNVCFFIFPPFRSRVSKMVCEKLLKPSMCSGGKDNY